MTKVIELLDVRYGRSRTERVEEAIEDLFKFREDDYEEDDALMMAMKEIRQRRIDLNITFGEFHAVWMLMKLRNRKKVESHELQALRNVVKENAADVIDRFEAKFKETRIEGKRRNKTSATTHYTDARDNDAETLYMGGESEARKRFRSFSRDRSQSRGDRQRSASRESRRGYEPRSGYNRWRTPERNSIGDQEGE